MPSHLSPENLTPGDRARMDQNWRAAGDALDELLTLIRAHRADGCRDWFCVPSSASDLLVAYELHEAQQMLAVAMERLIASEDRT